MISVFDMFKIGIGPSSSHTVGPMKAGKQFIDDLIERHLLEKATHIQVDVYGSLSMTGFGHSTDIAIIMGLAGYLPHNVDIEGIPGFIAKVNKTTQLPLAEGKQVAKFDPATDMIFHKTFLPLHENGMTITAFADTIRSNVKVRSIFAANVKHSWILSATDILPNHNELTYLGLPYVSLSSLICTMDYFKNKRRMRFL